MSENQIFFRAFIYSIASLLVTVTGFNVSIVDSILTISGKKYSFSFLSVEMDKDPDPNRHTLDANPDSAKLCRSDRIWVHNTGICFTVYLYESIYDSFSVIFPGCYENRWILDEQGTSIKAEI
jgi:hypothetical protein